MGKQESIYRFVFYFAFTVLLINIHDISCGVGCTSTLNIIITTLLGITVTFFGITLISTEIL